MKRTGTTTGPIAQIESGGVRSKIEDNSISFKSETTSSVSSVTTFSNTTEFNSTKATLRRRMTLAAEDLAKLLESLEKSDDEVNSPFDMCTGPKGDRAIRARLNEKIYELMVAKALTIENVTGSGALRRSTSETPFVDAPLTGNEAVDLFITERTARLDDGETNESENKDDEANYKTSAWQTSSAWRRGLLILLFVLLVVALSHIASSIFLLQSTEVFEHPYACKTKSCLTLSSWLLEGIENTTNPCDDFYQFACGTYLRNHQAPDAKIFRRISEAIPFNYISNEGLGRVLHRVMEYPLNQILPFYQACIDQDQRDKVGFRPFLNLLLQLKLMDPVKAGSTMDVSRTLIRIYKKVNKRIFIDIYSTRENFIVVNLGQPDKEYQLAKPEDYASSMRKAFTLLKSDLNIMDESEIDTIVYLVMRFEAEVILIQSKQTLSIFGFPDEMNKYVKIPGVFHPNYIPSETGSFRFDSFMTELFDHQRNFQNVTIFFNYIHSILKQEERLNILFLEDLLNHTPYYVLLRYFQWVLIKHFALDLTWDLQQIMFHIFRWVGPTPDERCFRNMFAKLHVLAATRYSKELTNLPNLNKKIMGLIDKVWETFKSLIESDPAGMVESFTETLTTLSIAGTSIGDFEKYIQLFYKGLDMNMKTHFENILQATSLKAKNDLQKLQNIPPFQFWPPGEFSLDEITISNMQNSSESRKLLNIPFAALQQPYLGNDLPIFDYGGFGFWIGAYYLMHYTIHDLLVIIGREREIAEPEGVVIPQKQMELVLLPRTDCIFDQYKRLLSFEKPEIQVDPTADPSRVKNLAFVAALQLLLETMKRYRNDSKEFPKHQVLPGLESYSPDQLFFLALTRHTCKPISEERRQSSKASGTTQPSYQINTAFRNSEIFTTAWKCPQKRLMNPSKKCKFFGEPLQPIKTNST